MGLNTHRDKELYFALIQLRVLQADQSLQSTPNLVLPAPDDNEDPPSQVIRGKNTQLYPTSSQSPDWLVCSVYYRPPSTAHGQ